MMKKLKLLILLAPLSFFLILSLNSTTITKSDPGAQNHLSKKNIEKIKLKVSNILGKTPLYFIKNKGQVNKRVYFYAKTRGYTLWITKEGLVFDYIAKEKSEKESLKKKIYLHKIKGRDVSRLKFINYNKNLKIIPINKSEYKVNYFKGNDKSKWVTDIETYTGVLFKNVYKNIDLKIYGKEKELEYDWIVKKGGDPKDIEFYYEGVKYTKIDKEGNIIIGMKFGKMRYKKPVSYQIDKKGKIENINSSFIKICKNKYKIRVKGYDKNRNLIIDPVVLLYSTYLGGNGDDKGLGIAIDNTGYAYVTGETYSSDFPTKNEYQGYQASYDAFVTKLNTNRSGVSSLLFSTYIGGSSEDYGYGITVDNNGYAYVSGTTYSSDFPVKKQYQGYQGYGDVFIIKLNTNGSGSSSLLYSTYFGGSNNDYGYGIVVDNNGYAYVSGYTFSSDFPVKKQYQGYQGYGDVFVTKLDTNSSGTSSLLYSTYFGGSNNDFGRGIAVDNNGYAYITGYTRSTDFPTKNEYQGFQGYYDVFVTKLDTNSSGTSSLLYSTYFGGNYHDYGYGIAVDNNGYAYITGETSSTDFPTKNEYEVYQGYIDAFVTKINTNSSGTSSLLYSTYIGGSNNDYGYGIAVDNNGYAYITGHTYSPDFPTKNQYQEDQASRDAFVTKINTNSSGAFSLLFSTYLGGSSSDYCYGIAVDNTGYAYITGYTNSSDFPTKNEYEVYQGYIDAFITKLALQWNISATVSGGNGSVSPSNQNVNDGHYATITITPDTGYEIESITDNGVSKSVSNPYTIQNVNEDHNVVITFKQIQWTVTATVSGGHGSVSPSSQTVDDGGSASITITPDSGYEIESITDNGVSKPIANPYVIRNIHENHTVVVRFKPITYTISASVSGGHGSVSLSNKTVNYGDSVTITITPDTGYEIDSITDNGVSKPISNPYIIKNVHENHTIVVKFKPMLTVSLSGERKTESAWIIRKDYGKLTISINNPSGMSYSLVIRRSSNGSVFQDIKSVNSSDISGNSYIYYDKYLDKNVKYSYQIIVKDSSGNIVNYSEIIIL